MSRTITISLYSTANSASFTTSSMFFRYPLVRNSSDFATRRGVSRNPSRVGSSPSSVRRRRIVSCILASYIAGAGTVFLRARQTTSASPDELYRHREDIVSAKQAADLWAKDAAAGNNFEASWKLSRAY